MVFLPQVRKLTPQNAENLVLSFLTLNPMQDLSGTSNDGPLGYDELPPAQ
jgi:hypothetical protein